MNREHFIRHSAALAGLSILPGVRAIELAGKKRSLIIPPYLSKGATIGITCPSGYFKISELEEAVQQIGRWGFQVKLGKTIGERYGGMGGTDEERAADFQQMLDDDSVNAIMCARGGYGVVRILDKIDFSHFRKIPKWIIGFSDITAFHTHINTNYQVATLHAKMCNSFPMNFSSLPFIQQEAINSIGTALLGRKKMEYSIPFDKDDRINVAEAPVVGGNLSMIASLAGSISAINTERKILFLEDTGEYLYAYDRMLWTLKRSRKFDKIKGLVIGSFNTKQQTDAQDEMAENFHQLVLEKIKDLDIPVCFGFPVGHQMANFAIKCGVQHRLTVSESGTTLEEI